MIAGPRSLFTAFLAGALIASIGVNVSLWTGGGSAGVNDAAVDVPWRQLRLTQEQVALMRERGGEALDLALEVRRRIRATTEQIHRAVRQPEFDEQRVTKLCEELRRLRGREIDLYHDTVLAVRGVLEPEQVEVLYRAMQSASPD